MMNQQEVREYAETYFRAFDSKFIESTPAYFSVELPIEVDKDLGNRPFYWTYVEKIGMEPVPLTLTFIFDAEQTPEHTRGELLSFGSRRLRQIFDSAKKRGQYVRMYESPTVDQRNRILPSLPLTPWLCVNYKIEFICDQKKDMLLPLGINLISGQIALNLFERLKTLSLTPRLPNYTFTMQPIFSFESAAKRLEQYVQTIIDREDRSWAKQALARLEEEKGFVESYYKDSVTTMRRSKETDETDSETERANLAKEKATRLKELEWQFEPRIEVSVINCGLFYLRSQIE